LTTGSLRAGSPWAVQRARHEEAGMEKAVLAFVLCLALLCSAFGFAFAWRQWPAQVDGRGFLPEIAAAEAEESL
jgi:hypothetical protein